MLQLKSSYSDKVILGVNTGHDGGACIIYEDRLVAISEERLTRKKQCSGYLYSLEYCLSALSLKASDIDVCAFSSYHDRLSSEYTGQLASFITTKNTIAIDHHLSHAYGGYFLSGFSKALIIVIDGLGNETDTESYYVGEGDKITKIGGNSSERSIYKGIGRAYENFTNYIGWKTTSAGKTMGLSSYGYTHGLPCELFSINDKCQVEAEIDGKYGSGVEAYLKRHNLSGIVSQKGKKEHACDLASYIQYQTTEVIVELVKRLVEKTGIQDVVVVGGVALNCMANQELLNRDIVKRVFVPPFPCDTGQCVGNAIAAAYQNGITIREEIPHAYLARPYSDIEIMDVLYKKQKMFALPHEIKKKEYDIYKCDDDNEYSTIIAEKIKQNKIIGWFQGASEHGPRALGARSILANPCNHKIRDHINENVKRRELYRPFAASIPTSEVDKYFLSGTQSKFMSFAVKIREEYKDTIPSALHVDQTSRIQSLDTDINKKYLFLLERLKGVNEHSIVINTSFNDNDEPIVESPVDALRHLALGHIDCLAIENYIVTLKD